MKDDNLYKGYTDQQVAFVEALLSPESEGCFRKAADMAGYSKGYQPSVIFSKVKPLYLQLLADRLSLQTVRAFNVIATVLDPTSVLVPGIKVKLSAAQDLLSRTGFGTKQSLDVESPDGSMAPVVFLPPKRNADSKKDKE